MSAGDVVARRACLSQPVVEDPPEVGTLCLSARGPGPGRKGRNRTGVPIARVPGAAVSRRRGQAEGPGGSSPPGPAAAHRHGATLIVAGPQPDSEQTLIRKPR